MDAPLLGGASDVGHPILPWTSGKKSLSLSVSLEHYLLLSSRRRQCTSNSRRRGIFSSYPYSPVALDQQRRSCGLSRRSFVGREIRGPLIESQVYCICLYKESGEVTRHRQVNPRRGFTTCHVSPIGSPPMTPIATTTDNNCLSVATTT